MLISESDSIEVLNLSTRVYQSLKRNKINTIKDLLSVDKDKFITFKNLGGKSLEEIYAVLNKIREKEINIVDVLDNQETIASKNKTRPTFIFTDGKRYYDILIDELPLSVRSMNCLKKENINYFSNIMSKTEEEFLDIANMGKKSIQEILTIVHSTRLTLATNDIDSEDNLSEQLYNKIFVALKDTLKLDAIQLYENIIQQLKLYLKNITFNFDVDICIRDSNLLNIIQNNDYIQEQYKEFIFNTISSHLYGCNEEFIYEITPCILKEKTFLLNILLNLCIQNKIIETNAVYVTNRVSFTDGLKSVLNDREYEVLIKRSQGLTLEEIGEGANVTRERIRQIESKALRKINNSNCTFKEDIYKDIYNKYYIKGEEFQIAFGNIQAYNYLSLRYSSTKGNHESKTPLIEALEDIDIPNFFKRRLEKAIYKDYVNLGKEYIPCTRNDITNYVLRTYALDDISFDDFTQIYFTILEDLGKSTDSKLSLMDRGYENKLSASNLVLWKYGKKFRFYDIDSYDFAELLEMLNLNQYENVEYSTLKFLRLYPELMKSYDIRDEYELHNLLKKICTKKDFPNITFARMPNIVFGNADRDSQVLELLLLSAPISNDKFALEYENEYGVAANTVLANYMKHFDEYFHDGMYKIDAPMLPPIIATKLKVILTSDFYLIKEIKGIYTKEFPNADITLLNPFSMKSLGFKVYSSYVVRDKYSSATEYFNYILTKNDITDVSKLLSNVKQTIAYTSCLYKLKSTYDIIEFSLDTYISSNKLYDNGITKEMLYEYVNDVLSYVDAGKFFTIHSLKKEGFKHDLDELGFDDWFYSSLLVEQKEGLSYIRFGGNKIFIKGNKDNTSVNFIENIIYQQDKLYMDIYDLIDLLDDYFKVKVSNYKLIEIARSSGMFYDAIAERIYADYDTYYEEI